MGQQPSAESVEHRGVQCVSCSRSLPANDWKYGVSNDVYYFYDETADKRAVIKYIRYEGNMEYYCIACVKKENTELYQDMRLYAAGKATLFEESRRG